METRASYLLVGLFVLTLIVGGIGFGMWLVRAGLHDDNVYYYVYFTGSVAGLQNGSAVQYRGVPVGRVTDIAIDEENVELIQVTVAIREGTPIKIDTAAQLQLQGITGLSFVQLLGGTQSAPLLEPRPGKRRAVIKAVPSPLEHIFERMPEITGQIVDLATRANDLLNDENRRAIGSVLLHLESILGTVATSREDIGKTLSEAATAAGALRETAQSLTQLAKELHGLTGSVGGDVRRLAARAEDTAKAFTQMAEEYRSVATENREAIRDFGDTGLYELTQFLAEARALVGTFQRLGLQFERDPARFLFGDQQRGVEAR